MRISNLIQGKSMIYSSNVYLVLGDWSAIDDVNTLIDAGNDPGILERLTVAPTGVGKHSIEQVILTHGHFDHTALLPTLRELYQPVVYAHSAFVGADEVLRDGQVLHCGDRYFEVIHTPGHSDDSICLYCQTDGALFVGDTPVVIRSTDSTYEDRFVAALERLCRLDVRTIYFGHGDPLTTDAQAALRSSLRNVRIARGDRYVR
jgi:glyoxylase-like metal-dependent hydrolase (beta-lactamase superfamily II)